jgi:hypothetical protein
MLHLDKVIKPWKESAALNDQINRYGFWNDTAFLTKSGDVGMVLRVPGVDAMGRGAKRLFLVHQKSNSPLSPLRLLPELRPWTSVNCSAN